MLLIPTRGWTARRILSEIAADRRQANGNTETTAAATGPHVAIVGLAEPMDHTGTPVDRRGRMRRRAARTPEFSPPSRLSMRRIKHWPHIGAMRGDFRNFDRVTYSRTAGEVRDLLGECSIPQQVLGENCGGTLRRYAAPTDRVRA